MPVRIFLINLFINFSTLLFSSFSALRRKSSSLIYGMMEVRLWVPTFYYFNTYEVCVAKNLVHNSLGSQAISYLSKNLLCNNFLHSYEKAYFPHLLWNICTYYFQHTQRSKYIFNHSLIWNEKLLGTVLSCREGHGFILCGIRITERAGFKDIKVVTGNTSTSGLISFQKIINCQITHFKKLK